MYPDERRLAEQQNLLTPAVISGFIAIIIVVIAAFVVNTASLRDVDAKAESVAHTYMVKAEMEGLLTTIVDAETNQRAFLITGNTSYLDRYNRAVGRMSPQIAQVRKETVDSQQQTDLDRLEGSAQLRRSELDEGIQLRQKSGRAAGEAAARINAEKGTMDVMRAIVARMQDREDTLLSLRTSQASLSYRAAAGTRFLTSGLALLAVALLLAAAKRSGKDRLRVAEIAERFRVTLASIGDGVIVTNNNGRITALNPVAEKLTGWTNSEGLGRPVEEVFRIVQEDSRLTVKNPAIEAMRQGIVTSLENHTILVAKDGQERPIDDSGSVIRNSLGRTIGSVLIFRDITERRRVEKERQQADNRAKRAAEEASDAKDQFLAILSHELRTPLSSIAGWSAILRSGKVDAEQTARALEVIERNARLETQLVESLLDVSRIIAGKLEIRTEQVDVAALTLITADSLQPSARHKGVTLDVSGLEEPVFVIGDSGRLQQVLSNLVSNAVKFTPNGGQVKVQLIRKDSYAQIEVSDNGAGISADFLPFIFDRFKQGDASKRARGGLGLGLAIARELVHAHGGEIVASSPGKGRGSKFSVRLPIAMPLSDAPFPVSVGNASEKSPIRMRRILVVDDEADARDLVATALESSGATIRCVSSAKEALDAIASESPDILIADIGMPFEDGYTLIRKLRAFEDEHGRESIPAIALTAYASFSDRERALAAGFDLHLTKPVDLGDLTQAVARLAQLPVPDENRRVS